MIKKIYIHKYKNCTVACFDTHIVAESSLDNGTRVKHYIYPDETGTGYWHEKRYLTHYDLKPVHEYELDISERRFWGKVRLVRKREICLPETWNAIAFSVRELEKLKIKEEQI